jgi:hypothetical protein
MVQIQSLELKVSHLKQEKQELLRESCSLEEHVVSATSLSPGTHPPCQSPQEKQIEYQRSTSNELALLNRRLQERDDSESQVDLKVHPALLPEKPCCGCQRTYASCTPDPSPPPRSILIWHLNVSNQPNPTLTHIHYLRASALLPLCRHQTLSHPNPNPNPNPNPP